MPLVTLGGEQEAVGQVKAFAKILWMRGVGNMLDKEQTHQPELFNSEEQEILRSHDDPPGDGKSLCRRGWPPYNWACESGRETGRKSAAADSRFGSDLISGEGEPAKGENVLKSNTNRSSVLGQMSPVIWKT